MKKAISIFLMVMMLCSTLFITVHAKEVDYLNVGGNLEVATTSGATLLWPVEGHTSLSRGFAAHSNKAIDINDTNISGATIRAALDGTVVKKFTCSHNTYPNFPTCCYGYGTGLAIKGSDNRYYCYGHMQSGSIPSSVKEGSKINQGDILGKVGSTGCCTGACLHFEICKKFWPNSDFVNPEKETYIYSMISPLNLGDKFYANIVPNSAGSLSVTANGANTNGTNVSLATLDYSDSQKWLFERKDGNAYKITNVQKNKCLDMDNYGTANGTNIQLWASNDSTAQRWYIVKNGTGYRLVPKCTPGSCLDITGGKLTAGTNIEEWTQNDSTAQRFNIVKTVDHKDIGTNFYANIICSNKNFAVSSNSSDNVIIYNADYSDYQKWYFERQADKTYKITNIKTGKCLDVNGKYTDNGTNIQVYNANTSTAQRWYVITNGDGYSLVPKCNLNAALDVDGANFKNNTNVQEWNSKLNDAQRIYIQKTVDHKDLGDSFYANIVSNDPAFSITADEDYNVSLQLTDGNDNQLWQFERNSDKTYRITNVRYERCLDVNGGYTDNGTNIKVYTPNNSNAQKWYVIINGSGYSLVPKCSITSALDVNGGVFEAGTNIQEWGMKLHDAQRVFINKTTPTPKPEVIDLSESELEMKVDESGLLVAYIEPEEADQTVIWSSDNESVASVDGNGLITAHDIGTAWISAMTTNGLMTRCVVTVTQKPISPEYIELSDYWTYFVSGETQQVYATVYPAEADQTVQWHSDDDTIATVDDNGLITAVSEGTATITVQTVDGLCTASFDIYVAHPYVEPEQVEWNGFSGWVNDDGTVTLTGYTGTESEITIPERINGYTVTSIAGILLGKKSDYVSVEVPNTITEIGFHAIGYYVTNWGNASYEDQKLNGVTIYGYKNSAAEAYAIENGFEFAALDCSVPSEKVLGDSDGDGNVTSLDVTWIKRRLAMVELKNFSEANADVDGDGEITSIDAVYLQRYLAFMDVKYPIGESK